MPPKKAKGKGAQPGPKKDKAKAIADATFGMKNKNKSRKVQQQIEQMKKQVNTVSKEERKRLDQIAQAKAEKKAKEAEKAQLAVLLGAAPSQQKVPFGVDPKSVLCNAFKQGLCVKGNKCKFSHDLSKGRTGGGKRSAYVDAAETERAAKEEDTMDKWDDDKLRDVINQKRDGSNRNLKTTIICKHFLKALEEKKYGWFWSCPGDAGKIKCQYVHALPPGYVLKDKTKKDEDKGPTLEEVVEIERKKLAGKPTTPVTLETFMAWKERKVREAETDAQKSAAERKKALKAGKAQMSGREAFEFRPDIFVDDAGAAGKEELVAQERGDSDSEDESEDDVGAQVQNAAVFAGEDEDDLDVSFSDEEEEEEEGEAKEEEGGRGLHDVPDAELPSIAEAHIRNVALFSKIKADRVPDFEDE
jgi:hypothetical protein